MLFATIYSDLLFAVVIKQTSVTKHEVSLKRKNKSNIVTISKSCYMSLKKHQKTFIFRKSSGQRTLFDVQSTYQVDPEITLQYCSFQTNVSNGASTALREQPGFIVRNPEHYSKEKYTGSEAITQFYHRSKHLMDTNYSFERFGRKSQCFGFAPTVMDDKRHGYSMKFCHTRFVDYVFELDTDCWKLREEADRWQSDYNLPELVTSDIEREDGFDRNQATTKGWKITLTATNLVTNEISGQHSVKLDPRYLTTSSGIFMPVPPGSVKFKDFYVLKDNIYMFVAYESDCSNQHSYSKYICVKTKMRQLGSIANNCEEKIEIDKSQFDFKSNSKPKVNDGITKIFAFDKVYDLDVQMRLRYQEDCINLFVVTDEENDCYYLIRWSYDFTQSGFFMLTKITIPKMVTLV